MMILTKHEDDVRLLQTSCLYETAPMYVTDQPTFLNGVILIETCLRPDNLLQRIKDVEQRLGRSLEQATIQRHGPRPIDLDILFYYQKRAKTTTTTPDDEDEDEDNNNDVVEPSWKSITVSTPNLTIPHPGIAEREFVLKPLCDMMIMRSRTTTRKENVLLSPSLNNVTVNDLYRDLKRKEESASSSSSPPAPAAVRVLPLPHHGENRILHLNEIIIMGILNLTPDSFSDGGKNWSSSNQERAVKHAFNMIQSGAHIIDIGGESTRPGAKEMASDVQIARTIPVIERIRQETDVPISIDTRHADVARAAVAAGADIVNDVSGGAFDYPAMLNTVAELGVPMIIMHMRGTPETMRSATKYDKGVVEDVATSLLERSVEAQKAGVHRWVQVLDPGIGFAKDLHGNLLLLRHLSKLQSMSDAALPMLIGTSRKGFIGKITGETDPEQRDYGTVASCVTALCVMAVDQGDRGSSDHQTVLTPESYNIVRVHNVAGTKQAMLVMDAILKAQ